MVSAIKTNDNGTVIKDASASLKLISNSTMILITGNNRCPHPSGIICASGGSMFSIFSTMIFLISPMLYFWTSPNGAFKNLSVSLSLIPSKI